MDKTEWNEVHSSGWNERPTKASMKWAQRDATEREKKNIYKKILLEKCFEKRKKKMWRIANKMKQNERTAKQTPSIKETLENEINIYAFKKKFY